MKARNQGKRRSRIRSARKRIQVAGRNRIITHAVVKHNIPMLIQRLRQVFIKIRSLDSSGECGLHFVGRVNAMYADVSGLF